MKAIFSTTNWEGVRDDVLATDPGARFAVCTVQADADAMDGNTYSEVYVDASGEALYQSVTVAGAKVTV